MKRKEEEGGGKRGAGNGGAGMAGVDGGDDNENSILWGVGG